jgi:nitrate reductase gamma subunit
MNESIFSLHNVLFGIYPYVCLSVFFIGSWLRFDREQYGWTSASSQLLSTGGMRWASNLFHIGILAIFGGHFVTVTPHSVFLMVMGDIDQYRQSFWARFSVDDPDREGFYGFGGIPTGAFPLPAVLRTVRAVMDHGHADYWPGHHPGIMGHAGHGDPRVVTAMAEWIQSIIYLYESGLSGRCRYHLQAACYSA